MSKNIQTSHSQKKMTINNQENKSSEALSLNNIDCNVVKAPLVVEDTLQKLFPFKNMIDLVKYPVITEKTYIALYKNRQYTFDVDKRLTKTQIKKMFSSIFNVDIIAINTHIPPRKKLRVGMAQGYRPSYKRAIITLKEGQFINYNLKKDN